MLTEIECFGKCRWKPISIHSPSCNFDKKEVMCLRTCEAVVEAQERVFSKVRRPEVMGPPSQSSRRLVYGSSVVFEVCFSSEHGATPKAMLRLRSFVHSLATFSRPFYAVLGWKSSLNTDLILRGRLEHARRKSELSDFIAGSSSIIIPTWSFVSHLCCEDYRAIELCNWRQCKCALFIRSSILERRWIGIG